MNKITRKSFLKVLAATMVGGAAASALTGAAAPVSIDETNGKVSRWVKNNLNPDGPLTIAKQGMFSSGGTVTAPVAGTYDATTNWLDTTRAGNTAHVDHANVLYQIPADSNGWPMVYLHGYGQSRMGWITTPDGRQGWADLFLRNGYSAFLVDQPRRGEAGSTAQMSTDGFPSILGLPTPRTTSPAIRHGTPTSALAALPRNGTKAPSSRRAMLHRISSSAR